MKTPLRLYHESPSRRRQKIAAQGLDPAYGAARRGGCGVKAVYLSSEYCAETCRDVWEVDTRNLEIDLEQHPGEETWWLAREIVPAANLRLVRALD